MATCTGSPEEVFVTRLGDLYFFPCAFPIGSELRDIAPDTRLYPCIGQPFFAIGVNIGHLRQTTQENLLDYRVTLALEKVWKYLLGKNLVVGDLPDVKEGIPSYVLSPA